MVTVQLLRDTPAYALLINYFIFMGMSSGVERVGLSERSKT